MLKRKRGEFRRSKRHYVWSGARIARADGSAVEFCRLLDISDGGARLEVANAEALPDNFTLLLSYDGRMYRQCAVVWRSQGSVGVEFVPDFPKIPT